ncbi:hypothetical protein CYMTET_4117 [Cymbomonas tetramitiformis]|uniref:RBR-type E3 ubiquitin transferase n=1 Tax=Cymbomonas tetramitiformis TaxID=36881 RepID=A0AAE0LKD1_9CHLO|nr:hypothetical protein CYMTET_4117 [Cymbomonas tetramitiformis]
MSRGSNPAITKTEELSQYSPAAEDPRGRQTAASSSDETGGAGGVQRTGMHALGALVTLGLVWRRITKPSNPVAESPQSVQRDSNFVPADSVDALDPEQGVTYLAVGTTPSSYDGTNVTDEACTTTLQGVPEVNGASYDASTSGATASGSSGGAGSEGDGKAPAYSATAVVARLSGHMQAFVADNSARLSRFTKGKWPAASDPATDEQARQGDCGGSSRSLEEGGTPTAIIVAPEPVNMVPPPIASGGEQAGSNSNEGRLGFLMGLARQRLVSFRDWVNNRAPKQLDQTFYCDICFENRLLAEEAPACLNGHRHCRDCMQGYFTGKIMTREVQNIICPSMTGNERCGATFSDEGIRETVEAETYQRLLRFRAMDADPRLCECPHCSHQQTGDPDNPDMICGQCGTTYCFEHAGAHSGVSCADFKRRNGRGRWPQLCRCCRGGEDTAEGKSTEWKKNNTKSCPKCKAAIQKSSGCNHMTCSQCKQDWCWLCGEPMTSTSQHYGERMLASGRPNKCYGSQMNTYRSGCLCRNCGNCLPHTCSDCFFLIILFFLALYGVVIFVKQLMYNPPPAVVMPP